MSVLPHFIKVSSTSDDNRVSSLRTDSSLIASVADSLVLANSTSPLFRPQNAHHFAPSRQYASTVIDDRANTQTSTTSSSTSTRLTLPARGRAGPEGSTSPAQRASPPAAQSATPSAEYSPRALGVSATVPEVGTLTAANRTNNPHFIEDILGRQRNNMDHNTGKFAFITFKF